MLTPHAEEYLEAIYRLGGQQSPVHLSLLAECLNLSAASVNEMVRRLEEQALVHYMPYKGVQLGPEGLCKALAILRRHRLWERFLTDLLGLSWDLVHEEACRLEHAASDLVTERLADLLQHPGRCPHGKPMPQPGCQPIAQPEAFPLSSLQADQTATVAYIAREEPQLLRYLDTLGLLPDTQVMVQAVAPFDGPLTIQVNSTQHVIGYQVASTIYVNQIVDEQSAIHQTTTGDTE